MPRELITVQIGQCGLQVGTRFWELALREHAASNKDGLFDEALSSFFRNVDTRFHPPKELTFDSKNHHAPLNKIATLKARAVLVDMEEGVLNELCRGSLAELFDDKQLIKDVSGSGNNFAHGHFVYGPQYGGNIMEAVRHVVEGCDSLQAFFLMHSLGGGTGSGLGTYILGLLQDAYPDVYRFVTCVFPSDQDDVVTSPYNSMLSLGQLIQHADCVLPIHNQALIDICIKNNKSIPGQKDSGSSSGAAASSKGTLLDHSSAAARANAKRERIKAFDEMNTLAAQLLTSLTCSMRFEGELNVDLNEITMNLVPFPKLHFLLASLAPLYQGKNPATTAANSSASFPASAASSSSSAAGLSAHNDARMPLSVASKGVDSMFSSLFSADSHLVKVNPKREGVYLACGVFARGDVSVSDLNRNIARLKKELNLISWNSDGFKIGLCSVPPVGLRQSLLSISNSSVIADLMSDLYDKCYKLYARKAHFHHYLEYMEQHEMDEAIRLVDTVVQDYANLERKDWQIKQANSASSGGNKLHRMRPIG